MENAFDTIKQAVDDARILNAAVDRQSTQLAQLLVGRLRHVGGWTLKDLKKELQRFNMRTGEWMD